MESKLYGGSELLENQISTFWEGGECNTEIGEETEEMSPCVAPGGIIDKVSSGEDGTK